jgi:hypothetical protein
MAITSASPSPLSTQHTVKGIERDIRKLDELIQHHISHNPTVDHDYIMKLEKTKRMLMSHPSMQVMPWGNSDIPYGFSNDELRQLRRFIDDTGWGVNKIMEMSLYTKEKIKDEVTRQLKERKLK